jgi:ABC-type branched-subunit amino acid transport system substrate-binding protein
MRGLRVWPLIVAAVAVTASLVFGSTGAAAGAAGQVVISRGQPVQLAFVGSSDFPEFTTSFRNALRMAVERQPTIDGHAIRINESDPPCFSGDFLAANAANAATVVSNIQNAAVIGQFCSQAAVSALPVYEAAGVVTVSGSASSSSLPPLAPTVFNRTIVVSDAVGDAGDVWLAQIATLPSDLAFQQAYQAEFGTPPLTFTDLYFDAANLVLKRIKQTSESEHGSLVIDRAALAHAVRDTTDFKGVTCTVTLDPATGNRVDDPAALAGCAIQDQDDDLAPEGDDH